MTEDESDDDQMFNAASCAAARSLAKLSTKAESKTRAARSRNYCFTLNNYDVADELYYGSTEFTSNVKYMIYGHEGGGPNKTIHLQGTVVWKTPKPFAAAKLLLGHRCHIEECADLFKSIEYCKKEGDFTEFGVAPVSAKTAGVTGGAKEQARWEQVRTAAREGRFDDIDAKTHVIYCKQLEHIHHKTLTAKPKVNTFEKMQWWYGATGTGKSRSAREAYPDAMIKPLNKWFDTYVDQEEIIIEDADPESCARMAHLFKVWTDHYPFPCEIKGSAMVIRPKLIIVTSNYTVEQCFPNAQDTPAMWRRFEEWEFTKLGKAPVLQNRQVVACGPGETSVFRTPQVVKPWANVVYAELRPPALVRTKRVASPPDVVERQPVFTNLANEDAEVEYVGKTRGLPALEFGRPKTPRMNVADRELSQATQREYVSATDSEEEDDHDGETQSVPDPEAGPDAYNPDV